MQLWPADWDMGAPGIQVRPNSSRRQQQQLPPATKCATAVLAIDGDLASGLIIVASSQKRVERTGHIAWKRTDLIQPWAAVLVGDAVLVTENGESRVVRLDMATGATRDTFGGGTLKNPQGIAVAAGGEIVVADYGTKLVHVFDWQGQPLRNLGQKLLHYPCDVCTDSRGRVYVADSTARKIFMLDGASGALLDTINAGGPAVGVALTHRGQIVTSVLQGQNLLIIS